MNEIDLSNYNIRTDLIIEDSNLSHKEEYINEIKITKTKKNGNYITISFPDITDIDNRKKVGKCLEKEIKNILKINKIKEDDSCLIVGLGNRLSTPDSLGTKTIDDILVTNHLFSLGTPKEGIRRVYAITPGVMANTGIESSLIISSIIKEIKPAFVIAIDALASKDIDRLNKTIQITDTGIHPGSGIGNNRLEISQKTMHIPVIAIGVPTVTTSASIVFDTINYLYKHITYIKENQNTYKLSFIKKNYKEKLNNISPQEEDKANLLGLFGSLTDIERKDLIDEVLSSVELNLIVTPTEIDFLILKLSNLIANAINNSLHRQINHF